MEVIGETGGGVSAGRCDGGHAGRHFILTVKKRRKITRCHSQYVVVVAVLPTSRSEFHF